MTTNDELVGWLARVALQDRVAFEQVYRATCAHLLGIAFRILNQRERAEEVLQESDACMADLVGHERQALALAYYRGLVHTQIAQALNAPLGTAKAWVRRGLEKLRRCLESAGVPSA